MIETLLELKQTYWGLDSEEYNEWKDYFLTLSEEELKEEYLSHFPDEVKA